MRPSIGQPAPLFQKTDSDGQLIDLNALKGKKSRTLFLSQG